MQKTSFARVDRTLAMPPLRTESSLIAVCCQAFKLTLNESRIFVTLLKFDHATKAELQAALSPNGDPVTNIQGVGVTTHTLRKKLASHNIDIISIYGLGYRLAEGARDRTRKILAEYGQDIISAVTPSVSPKLAAKRRNQPQLKNKALDEPDLFSEEPT